MTDSTIIFVASAISGAIASVPGIIAALKMGRVEKKVEVVREIVDGPLSVALESNAVLARRVANETGRPEDEAAAVKAETIDKNRKDAKKE